MANKFIAQELADYYANLETAAIPPQVINKGREALVDFIGVLVTGYREGVFPPLLDSYLQGLHGLQESTWLSRNIKTPSIDAATSMGAAAHAVELDDGYRFGTSHPAVAVIPAALALCEREGKSFPDLIRAIIIGYDVMLRLSSSINPSHWKRGYHSTSTCGVFGSAFAAASLLGLNAEQTAHAAAIAGLQSAGLQEMLHSNPAIKPFQVGKASANGLMAAELAALGARGPLSLFEGEHGWLAAVTDHFNREALFTGLGTEFEILNIYTKIYPTCRHCHAAIDLALVAQAELPGSCGEIDQITVKTYDIAIAEVGKIYCPTTYDDAMFSLPFSVALALKNGKVTLQDYHDKNYQDPVLKEIQQKIKIEPDQDMNEKYPNERGCSLAITTRSDSTWQKAVKLPRGEPESPFLPQELFNKLSDCLNPYYRQGTAEAIWQQCCEVEIELASYQKIIEILDPINTIDYGDN